MSPTYLLSFDIASIAGTIGDRPFTRECFSAEWLYLRFTSPPALFWVFCTPGVIVNVLSKRGNVTPSAVEDIWSFED